MLQPLDQPPVHVRYGYDASDRRATTSVLNATTAGQYGVTERYYYDGSDLVLVADGLGNVASRYLYGPTADGNEQALAADARITARRLRPLRLGGRRLPRSRDQEVDEVRVAHFGPGHARQSTPIAEIAQSRKVASE